MFSAPNAVFSTAMGFEFAETMQGTVEWDAEPGRSYPFKFEVTAHAESVRAHLRNGKAALHGVVHAPPRADSADAEGTITIRPLGQKIIRYELSFPTDDGHRLELVGQKDISFLHPFRSFTQLPAELRDERGQRVGTCKTHFDLGRDLWSFVRSFRPA